VIEYSKKISDRVEMLPICMRKRRGGGGGEGEEEEEEEGNA
jgi:hypothetical protein